MTIGEMIYKMKSGEAAGWAVILLVLILSLIQISPLKLNPWDSILGWFGKKMNGKEMEDLKKQVSAMWVNNHRAFILTFARECRHDVEHSPDEWTNVLTIADEYEVYCDKHKIANGVVKADTQYIRALYLELSHSHKI